MSQKLQQGQVVELEITDLNTDGDGVGRHEGTVVFVPNTVTGDRLTAKIVQSKAKFAKGKLEKLLNSSPHRIRPGCIVADKCGGCQWQHIEIDYQREAKQQQVIQAFQRIGGFADVEIQPILHADHALNYRNKCTYPLGRSSTGQVQAGYYRQGSHKLINLNQCPVQDERLHPLLREVKQDIQERGWSIYNETNHQGKLRHLSLRIGQNTGEMLLTLISTDRNLAGIEEQAQLWLDKYPGLVGVCLNLNRDRTNAILGKTTQTILGKPYLREIFAGVELHIAADTFFQVNTSAAELLLQTIIQQLKLTGSENIIDAYCGVGTFSLPLAQRVQQVVGIELNHNSVRQAQSNAALNQINNAIFWTGKVKDCLQQIEFQPDILLLDPPRKGCDPQVLETILKLKPERIVYVSCKPATLARDVQLLCASGTYQLSQIQPADFFPQTTHVECCAILNKL
ncbi:MAG: 23S rRNA (uracil(1939)-C(5))-methyltransferase RlmD [Pleurocapsa minor HA4230-MV1]|jgi:23S rRNA (uracil1939-C5)-methyltransferase|nr:23S rRNA (uracil(1939)-C(5))-methyltransferase RlmD [Pleurocapsa minor HA4230-MV1]